MTADEFERKKSQIGDELRVRAKSPCFACPLRGNQCRGPQRDGTPREDCQL